MVGVSSECEEKKTKVPIYYQKTSKLKNSLNRTAVLKKGKFGSPHHQLKSSLERNNSTNNLFSRYGKNNYYQPTTFYHKIQHFFNFFWAPLSSTHQFNTKGPLLFNPQNPSVQHQKPLTSTHLSFQHTPQFNTSLSTTKKLIKNILWLLRGVLN